MSNILKEGDVLTFADGSTTKVHFDEMGRDEKVEDFLKKTTKYSHLDTFTQAYIEAAFFTDAGPDDDCAGKTFDDLAPIALFNIISDCREFQQDNYILLDKAYDIEGFDRETLQKQAGHDFWLTRDHHGAGFWDGDWPKDTGKKLTEAAHKFKEVNLYLGDDGKVYI